MLLVVTTLDAVSVSILRFRKSEPVTGRKISSFINIWPVKPFETVLVIKAGD